VAVPAKLAARQLGAHIAAQKAIATVQAAVNDIAAAFA
jgi:hypothetical protein